MGMAQYWKLKYELTQRDGNVGNIYGSDPAAMRYTHSGLSEFANDTIFGCYEPRCIQWRSNYSNELLEPVYLQPIFPLILINGSFGIGYGLSSGIPPFQMEEVAEEFKALIKDKHHKINILPEMASKCEIINTDWKALFNKGEGNFITRAPIDITSKGNLLIRGLPFQVTLNQVIDTITAIKKDNKGLKEVKDAINRTPKLKKGEYINDLQYEIVLSKGSNPNKVMADLYKMTPLQKTFSVNFEVTMDNENIHCSLQSLFELCLSNLREFKTRYYVAKYVRLDKEIEDLKCIIDILFSNLKDDKLNKLKKTCKNRSALEEALIKEYGIDDAQAETISGFRQYQYTKEYLERYKNKYAENMKEFKEVEKIVENEKEIDKKIIEDLDKIVTKYNQPRECTFVEVQDAKKLKAKARYLIAILSNNKVKKIYLDDTDKGLEEPIGNIDDGVEILTKAVVTDNDKLLVFTEDGLCYNIPVEAISTTSLNSKGEKLKINSVKKKKDDEKDETTIVKIMKCPEKNSTGNIICITQNGIIKKSKGNAYSNIKSTGSVGIVLKKDDKLIDAIYKDNNSDLLIYTANGYGLRMEDSINITQRATSGVIGISLTDGDYVTGLTVIGDEKYIVVVTNKGLFKKFKVNKMSISDRGTKGCTIIGQLGKDYIVGIITANAEDSAELITSSAIKYVPVEEIKEVTKLAKGDKVKVLHRGEYIVKVR